MHRQIFKVLSTTVLAAFIVLSVYSIKTQTNQIQIKSLEVKSTEAKLIELNSMYESTLKSKIDTEAQKQEQLDKIKQLEEQRQRLESELQAKAIKYKQDSEKLTTVAQNTSGAGSAAALSSKEQWMTQAGIPQSEWANVNSIVTRESGWNPNAVNKSSGACGLGQQLPCGKWAGAWNDPVAALKAMTIYVNARYGGWSGAVGFWNKNRWY
jgi:hypothetical protein